MFASIQTKDSSRVFRISYVLKNEEVNPEFLKIAVKDTLKRFPAFSTRCKEGFFWAYLEHTDIMPEICEESEMPAAIQNHGRNGGPDLRVLYYKRRISVEIAHVITDGDGAFEFTKSLVAHYINLVDGTANKDEAKVSTRVTPTEEETENAEEAFVLPENRSVDFTITGDGDALRLGDVAHFSAKLAGYEGLDYTLQWQMSTDNENWEDIPEATGEQMDLVLTEENSRLFWRVTVLIHMPQNEETQPEEAPADETLVNETQTEAGSED